MDHLRSSTAVIFTAYCFCFWDRRREERRPLRPDRRLVIPTALVPRFRVRRLTLPTRLMRLVPRLTVLRRRPRRDAIILWMSIIVGDAWVLQVQSIKGQIRNCKQNCRQDPRYKGEADRFQDSETHQKDHDVEEKYTNMEGRCYIRQSGG